MTELPSFLNGDRLPRNKSRLESLNLTKRCLWSGWNGPLARSVGRPARQSSAFEVTGSQKASSARLGGKLPPRTARLAVPPNPSFGAYAFAFSPALRESAKAIQSVRI